MFILVWAHLSLALSGSRLFEPKIIHNLLISALTDDKSSTDQENVKEPPVKTSESPKRIFTCEWCGKVWTNEVPFLVHPIMCPKKPKVKGKQSGSERNNVRHVSA